MVYHEIYTKTQADPAKTPMIAKRGAVPEICVPQYQIPKRNVIDHTARYNNFG